MDTVKGGEWFLTLDFTIDGGHCERGEWFLTIDGGHCEWGELFLTIDGGH